MSNSNETTFIILNPHACGGKARKIWQQVEPLLKNRFEGFQLVTTQTPDEIAGHLYTAAQQGMRRIIAVGGDGTNHTVINEVIAYNAAHPDQPQLIYGNVPIGTGRDWARGLGIPTSDVQQIANWLINASPKPIDVGSLTYTDSGSKEYFLNIASVGLGGEVALRVNRAKERRAWTFYAATVATILQYKPQAMRIKVDGIDWYEGGVYLLAVANGSTFGRGMKVAPNALVDDGIFDIVLAKAVSRLEILTKFQKIYSGTHLSDSSVKYTRGQRIDVELIGEAAQTHLSMELDGESSQGRTLTFEVRPQLLEFLR